MPTDYKGKIMYSMTQAKFNELREANGGKLPAQYANSYVYTDAEDVNLSQMRTKVLWTNPNPTSAFEAQNITLSDGNYDYLEFILRATTGIDRQYSVKVKKGSGANFLTYYQVTWSPYNYDQFRTADYISDTEYSISDNYRRSTDKSDIGVSDDQNIPIEIIGYYKSPAMIYTGAELHEGNLVSIKDGVVSVNLSGSDSIEIKNGIISEKSKMYVNRNDFLYSNFSNTANQHAVLYDGTFTTTRNSNVLISFGANAFGTSGTVAYMELVIDGNMIGWTGTNLSITGVSYVRSVPLSKGTHTYNLRIRADSGNIATLHAYNSVYLILQEV